MESPYLEPPALWLPIAIPVAKLLGAKANLAHTPRPPRSCWHRGRSSPQLGRHLDFLAHRYALCCLWPPLRTTMPALNRFPPACTAPAASFPCWCVRGHHLGRCLAPLSCMHSRVCCHALAHRVATLRCSPCLAHPLPMAYGQELLGIASTQTPIAACPHCRLRPRVRTCATEHCRVLHAAPEPSRHPLSVRACIKATPSLHVVCAPIAASLR
jgi:hypothetical protein